VLRPKIGSMEVRKVTPADIMHMLERSKRSWTVCKRILTTSTQLFAHASGKRMIDVNPCVGITQKSIMGPRPTVRSRVMLSEDELRKLLGEIDETIGREHGLALRVLLAKCVRTVELAYTAPTFLGYLGLVYLVSWLSYRYIEFGAVKEWRALLPSTRKVDAAVAAPAD
jgi:hypothetical protein